MALKIVPIYNSEVVNRGWNDEANWPTEPGSNEAARDRLQTEHDQTIDYINKYLNYTNDTAMDDSYIVSLDPAPSEYFAGLMIQFKAGHANTGACSLNVNGLGAKTIKKNVDQDPVDNDIKAGQIVCVIYDGTNFQMISEANTNDIAKIAVSSRIYTYKNIGGAL